MESLKTDTGQLEACDEAEFSHRISNLTIPEAQ